MGLIVYVLKTSGEQEMRTLMQADGFPVPGSFEPTPERPAVIIDDAPAGNRGVYDAVQCSIEDGDPRPGWKRKRDPDKVGPMADGRWIHTSDGRFPADAPLRYFDRWETPAQYASYD